MSFETLSNQSHSNWYDKVYNNIHDRFKVLENWESQKKTHTINYWLHWRMFSLTDPLAKTHSSWLTIGDGYGFDANYLKDKGCNAVASDIAATFLPKSKEMGIIDAYSIENVEKISFADNSFDYCLCKEAYHHFPRPMLGVYEMLRISKTAIILIEPLDPISRNPFLLFLKNVLDGVDIHLLQKIWKNRYSFETVGNYVYKISEREIEKLAMGLNLPAIAFKGINNNYYHAANASEIANGKTKSFRTIQFKLKLQNFLCRVGITPFQTLSAIIFKKMPSQEIIESLKQEGYLFYELPKNPYLINDSSANA